MLSSRQPHLEQSPREEFGVLFEQRSTKLRGRKKAENDAKKAKEKDAPPVGDRIIT